MNKSPRILVGIDREGMAVDALALAAELARVCQGDLHALHVVESTRKFWPFGTALPSEAVQREGQRVLKDASARAVPPGSAPELHVRDGHPVREIERAVREIEADLLVLGRHHEGALDPVVGGTVQRVIRRCPCPVLVHKRLGRDVPSTVLVAVDLSPVSLHALATAVAWMQPFKVTFQVLYVFEPPILAYPAEEVAMPTYIIDDARRAELNAFKERMSTFDWKDIPHVLLELDGDPGRTIVDATEKGGAELVVVGTHGRTGLDRFLLGSVAEHVIRHAKASVLIVPGEARRDRD